MSHNDTQSRLPISSAKARIQSYHALPTDGREACSVDSIDSAEVFHPFRQSHEQLYGHRSADRNVQVMAVHAFVMLNLNTSIKMKLCRASRYELVLFKCLNTLPVFATIYL